MQLVETDVATIVNRGWAEISQIAVPPIDDQRAKQLGLDQVHAARLAVTGS